MDKQHTGLSGPELRRKSEESLAQRPMVPRASAPDAQRLLHLLDRADGQDGPRLT